MNDRSPKKAFGGKPERSRSSSKSVRSTKTTSGQSSYGRKPRRDDDASSKPRFRKTDDESRPSRFPRSSSDKPYSARPRREGDTDSKPRFRKTDDESRPSRFPRSSSDKPYSARLRREGDTDSRPRFRKTDEESRPSRFPRSSSDKPYSARPRREGDTDSRPRFRKTDDESRPSRFPRSSSDKPYSARPRREGDTDSKPRFRKTDDESRPSRFPRSSSDKPYSARPRRDNDDDRKPRVRKTDDESRPSRFPRSSSDKPYSARPIRDNDDERKPRFRKTDDESRPSRFPRSSSDKPYSARPRRDNEDDRKPRFRKDDDAYVAKPRKKTYSGEESILPKKKNDNSVETRLNKYIANSGICSRREADDYITAGVVSVNGKIITEMGFKVQPGDDVRFNGERIKGETKVYLVMNKPKDYVTSTSDPHADKTVMDLIGEKCIQRVFPIGRLDKNTTGVLLLTNDGEMTEKLTHPSFNKKKIYDVHLNRKVKVADLRKLVEGIELEDGLAQADQVEYVGTEKTEVGVEIHSGRNRVVRRMFEELGYTVEKLDRVYFAGITKKNLKRGQWRFLTESEINALRMGSFE